MPTTNKNTASRKGGTHEDLGSTIAFQQGTKKQSSQDISLIEVKNDSVSSVGLHQFLGVKTPHTKWVQRIIADYEFINGRDFRTNLSESTGGRQSIDYLLSVHTAKEICMVSKTQTAKQARKYFITCEEKLKSNEPPKFQTSSEALLYAVQNMVNLEREQKEQAQKIQELDIKIETVASQPRLEVKGYKHTRDVLRAQKDELGNSINILVNRYFGEYMGISDFPTRFRTAYAKYYRDTGIPYCGANTATSDDKADFLGWLKLLVMKSSVSTENFLETLNEAYL
jgi:phage anti-repressor protein